MSIEGIANAQNHDGETESIRQMIAANSEKARVLTQQRIEHTLEAERTVMRAQLDALSFSSERSIANEMANRTLSKMFGSFSLIQKIMQNMG